MRKKATTKRHYFTMESAMTAILRDASGKMHHRILFARRLATVKPIFFALSGISRQRTESYALKYVSQGQLRCCNVLRHISQAFSTDYFPRSRQIQLYKHLSLRGIRFPEPTSRLRQGSLSTERRLMRMVEQNGGKLRRLKKIIKKSCFVGIKKFLRGTSLLDVQIWMGK